MSKQPSLLSRVNSKDVLKKILSLAYSDMKSVFKLVAYNKNLLKKLDINIKDYYQYNIIKIVNKLLLFFVIFYSILEISIFICFVLYTIYILKEGRFNDKILKEGYNVQIKNFVDFMDNYCLVAYLVFIILKFLLLIFIFITNCIIGDLDVKIKIFVSLCLIEFLHYIMLIIKFCLAKNIINKELLETDESDPKLLWYTLDNIMIELLPVLKGANSIINYYIILVSSFIIPPYLNQINKININEFELPEGFNKLNEKDKNKLIFKKENMEEYSYNLNFDQILLIGKLNDIRYQNHLRALEYHEEEKLPDFIKNPKTLLILFPNENIYKLSTNLYIFKYLKNEFQNHLNDREILNIITIDFLDRISILEQNDIEFISIYKNNLDNNRLNNRINERNVSNDIESGIITNANTKDELNDQVLNLNIRGKSKKSNNDE